MFFKKLHALRAIGVEMVSQSNRCTQYPLFMVEEDVRRYVDFHDDWDGRERREDGDGPLCHSCDELSENGDELPDDCGQCGVGQFFYFKKERVLADRAGTFFTAKACQKHIDENLHHYSKPETYAISAWRNPEMVLVMQILIKLSGSKLPSYYR